MGKTQAQYVADEKGECSAVVMPIEEYDESLEDSHNLAVIAGATNQRSLMRS